MKRQKRERTLMQKRARVGLLFSLPFLIGFFAFYLFPVAQSILFSFADLTASKSGMKMEMVGLKNYSYLLFEDPNYIKYLTVCLKDMLINVPCVILFSFFIAVVLNQQFHGRALARMFLFLPVVVSSGVTRLLTTGVQTASMASINAAATDKVEGVAQISDAIVNMITTIKISPAFLDFITSAVARASDIVSLSGIQILIFLAGLQTISPSLYEASSMEGATGWENFWKITFPMVSPIILVNAVYTIIDSMSGLQNYLIYTIYDMSFNQSRYGRASAMGWIYYLIIFAVLAVFLLIFARRMHYEND